MQNLSIYGPHPYIVALVSCHKCRHKPWIAKHARAPYYQLLRAELHAG